MRIQDIELQTGLDRATIRYYEKEGLVIPRRLENGYREYSRDDVQLLLKIKLLRQLGISLNSIKSLQQGSGSFCQILAKQILTLEEQQQKNRKARQVCLEIQNDGEQYCNLNTSYYLRMLHEPSEQDNKDYTEDVVSEQHPVRRFFARSLDLALFSALIQFVFSVLLRVRPWNTPISTFVQFLSLMAYIPIEATLLHFWGTTPGKWVFGIRLESVNGGKLSYSAAIYRSFTVAFAGCGLYIPFIEIWRLYKSYRSVANREDLPWDEETELIYTNWRMIQKAAIVILFLISICLTVCAGNDAVLPRHRNDLLTVDEFAENFRFYEALFDIDDQYILEDDGTWTDTSMDNNHSIVIIGNVNHTRAQFQYTFIDNKITQIHYKDSWDDVSFLSTLPHYCECAVLAAIGSRPGLTHKELAEAGEQFIDEFYNQFNLTPSIDQYSGTYTYKDIEISWDITMNDIEYIYEGVLLPKDGATGTYTLDFSIVFQQ